MPRGCAHVAYAVDSWREKAREARQAFLRWRESQWLIKEQGSWEDAVQLVQRFYPGTSSWLWSCSGAEGGHGRWVTYGGGSYYPGFEDRYIVGGPMQFKWPTFKGMYRRAVDDLRSQGYRFEPAIADSDDVQAWLSYTAQALAAGWARYTGNDDSHWSASWNTGCR